MSQETSPVQRAVIDNNVMLLRSQLSSDPSLALQTDADGRTPLHWACSFQRPEMVKILLDPAGDGTVTVDIDSMVDASGWTPFHIAASVGNLDVVYALAAHTPAPDANLQTGTGQTSLHYAVSKGHYEVASFLVRKCHASARVKDNKGQYPLHRAAATGSIKMCELLIKEARAALNPRDSYGYTPLHHSLAEGHGDVAVYLVEQGADYGVEDNEGRKPVDVSVDDKVRAYFVRKMKEGGYE